MREPTEQESRAAWEFMSKDDRCEEAMDHCWVVTPEAIAAYGLREREKERERCAEIAREAKEDFTNSGEQAWYNNACDDIAAAIERESSAAEEQP